MPIILWITENCGFSDFQSLWRNFELLIFEKLLRGFFKFLFSISNRSGFWLCMDCFNNLILLVFLVNILRKVFLLFGSIFILIIWFEKTSAVTQMASHLTPEYFDTKSNFCFLWAQSDFRVNLLPHQFLRRLAAVPYIPKNSGSGPIAVKIVGCGSFFTKIFADVFPS